MSFLNDTWVLYFHDPSDNANWTIDSYHKLATIATVEEFAEVFTAFQHMWGKGMFFIFREHSLPMWEHETNRRGGCLSYKANRNDAATQFFDLAARILGETAADDGESRINGFSITPKRNYSLLRVWLADTTRTDGGQIKVAYPSYAIVQFKSHSEEA